MTTICNGLFVSRQEAACILKVHLATIDRYVAEGKLARFKLGRLTRFCQDDVIALLVDGPIDTVRPRSRPAAEMYRLG